MSQQRYSGGTMIISRGRNYIFVHIPKTGGTSLTLALEDRAKKDDIILADTPKGVKRRKRVQSVAARGRLWKHSTLRDIVGLVAEAEIPDFFVFTLVRNPWDRMLSYYHWLRYQSFDHPAVGLAKAKDFSSFLNADQTAASIKASPYGSYVTLPDGKEHCQAFVRLEHLAVDLEPVEAHLGFKLRAIPKTNASDRPENYRAAYSDEDAARVRDLCSEDIRRFGYVF